uniref:DUF4351 domain-containing protein n=1 Tax=Candidatus Kentrum sp. FW TaxID=2126338 RepID=A0A450SJQ2_9GAMM|nr:MAG: protein of unknown function (DUF4351) [Candidatus Kentron sp. FW]
MERGIEEGMGKGLEQGLALGIGKGEAGFLIRQLGYKFGILPPELLQRIESARPEDLALWGQRVLNAKTLNDVFL